MSENRNERIVILLSRDELAAVETLARVERLPVSTMTRRLLLEETERRRIIPHADRPARTEGEMHHATQ